MSGHAGTGTQPLRPVTWPWVVLGLVLVGAVVIDAVTAWQFAVGMTPGYNYWLETTVSEITYGVVGAVICVRVRGNLLGPIMLAVAVVGVVQGLAGCLALTAFHLGWPAWLMNLGGGVFGAVQARSIGLLTLLLLLAPTGRPLTPRWRRPMLIYVGLLVVSAVATLFAGPDPGSLDEYPAIGGIALPVGDRVVAAVVAVGQWALLLGVAVGCVCLALRWRRSAGLERQQVTWVVLGGLAGPVLVVLDATVTMLVTGSANTSGLHGSLVWAVAGATLPVGIAVAVFRHGLYDLDRVVSRTVSYVIVSGLLLAVYAVIVTLVPRLLPNADSLSVAAATLAAAALARPVLRRVQASVDRRFNRTRFDAQAAVSDFARALDRQVDIEAITSGLDVVVRRTVAPASVSLWLRDRP